MDTTTKMSDPIILGVDVGSAQSGWALLASTGRQSRARFVAGGMVASDDVSILTLLRDRAKPVDGMPEVVVAIEEPAQQFGEHRGSKHLLASRGVAGAVGMAATMLGCVVVRMSVQQVRNAMCRGGRGTPGDMAVKYAVRQYVTELPKQTNTHVRDAILVACVVLFNRGRLERIA